MRCGAELYGNTGNLTLELHWYSRSGSTTGNVTWSVQLAAITPTTDTQNVETKAYATAQTVNTTVNSGTKGLTLSTLTITNLDSVNAGDDVWLRVTRTDTSMVGDAILSRLSLSYSDGNSGTAGSGDVVGPASATNTAVAVYNGTTGKLIQNTPFLIDGSGNVSGGGTYNTITIDKFSDADELATAFPISAATTMTTITGLSIALPRAGSYWLSGMFSTTATATLTCTFGLNVSANFTRMALAWQNYATATSAVSLGMQVASLAAGAVGTSGFATLSRTATTAIPVYFSGSVTVSGAATITLLGSRSASTLTVNVGSSWKAFEK